MSKIQELQTQINTPRILFISIKQEVFLLHIGDIILNWKALSQKLYDITLLSMANAKVLFTWLNTNVKKQKQSILIESKTSSERHQFNQICIPSYAELDIN